MSGPSATPAPAAKKKPSVKSAPPWAFLLLIIFIAIVVVLTISNDIRRNPSEDNSSKADESTEMEMIIPNEYVEYHLLKKGADSTVINIPKGYTCDYYGGGKKYYHQAQNGPKEIWGGKKCSKNSSGQEVPTGLGNPEARYAYISYYEEEITVMCEFKKKKK